MNTTVAISLISVSVAVFSFVGNYLGAQRAQAAHQAVIDTKIDNLTKQVEKHNKLAERVAYLETVVSLLLEKRNKE